MADDPKGSLEVRLRRHPTRCQTSRSARLKNQAQEGNLEEGQLADFIVLSGDPLTIDPNAIADLTVLKAVVGGRLVWDSTV